MNHISRRHLAEVIGEKTLHTVDDRRLALAIAAFLLDEGLTGELDSLLRDVLQYRMEHGVAEASVLSAHELSRDVLDDIEQLLKQEYAGVKTVTLDTTLDRTVVGGVRVELPNEQLDLTVKAKLDTFKRLTSGEV